MIFCDISSVIWRASEREISEFYVYLKKIQGFLDDKDVMMSV